MALALNKLLKCFPRFHPPDCPRQFEPLLVVARVINAARIIRIKRPNLPARPIAICAIFAESRQGTLLAGENNSFANNGGASGRGKRGRARARCVAASYTQTKMRTPSDPVIACYLGNGRT